MPSLLDGGSRAYAENPQILTILFLFCFVCSLFNRFLVTRIYCEFISLTMAEPDCGANAKVNESVDISGKFSDADIMANSASRLPPLGSGRIAVPRARAHINVHSDNDMYSTFPRRILSLSMLFQRRLMIRCPKPRGGRNR